MRLLVCDSTAPDAIAAMRNAGIEVDECDDITPEALEDIIGDYDAIVVRSRTKVGAELLDKATRLRAIIRAGVGVDNIDVKYARSKRMFVLTTAAAPANSVAELTIGYLFALARGIPQATTSMKSGSWDKKTYGNGTELMGKRLGLIGCGRIGSLVAKKAIALGMEVGLHCLDFVDIPGAVTVSLEELLIFADFISLHLPYTPDTHYIIGGDEFAKMKDGVYIVNTARGGVLDEDALYDAIVSGKVAGVALDVFEDEDSDRGKRLFTLPQVIGSPHMGSGTVEAKARIGDEVAEIAIRLAQRL